VLFYAIALGFKEFAVMILPALFVYQRLEQGVLPVNFRKMASYVPFVSITLLYLFARQSVTGAFLSPSDDGSFFLRLVYAPWLVLLNLKYLVSPLGLHSFIFWYPQELMSFESISGVLGLVLLAGFVWIFRRNRAVVFAFAGFLPALFPVLNIIRTSAVTLVSLRWLYFPSVFLAVALAVLVSRGLGRRWHLTTVVLAVVLVYFGVYSYVLNQYLWHDEETFFRQEATHFDNAYYFSGFARQLHREGSHEQAKVYYDRALDRYPRDPDLRISYGGFLADTGRLDEAVRELRKAEKLLRVPIHKARWYNNIGTVYFMKKDYRKALGYYRSAVSLVPGDELFRANEGSALGAMGRYDEAVRVFKKGLEFNPGSGMLIRRLELARRKKNPKPQVHHELDE
jgi:hypothetical protein